MLPSVSRVRESADGAAPVSTSIMSGALLLSTWDKACGAESGASGEQGQPGGPGFRELVSAQLVSSSPSASRHRQAPSEFLVTKGPWFAGLELLEIVQSREQEMVSESTPLPHWIDG